MHRSLGIVALLALLVAAPAPARADLLGAYLQAHGGYQRTNRTAHPAYGAAAGIFVLGFEGYAGLRFLRGDGLAEDRGMWNTMGLRFGIDLPIPVVKLRLFAGVAYVYSKVADEDVDATDPDDPTRYKGFNPHVGVRLDVPLFKPLYLGVQLESGYHYLFPNDLPYSAGPNFSALGALKLAI